VIRCMGVLLRQFAGQSLASLYPASQIPERRRRAALVVSHADSRRQPLMANADPGALRRIRQDEVEAHLAGQQRVVGLECGSVHDELVPSLLQEYEIKAARTLGPGRD